MLSHAAVFGALGCFGQCAEGKDLQALNLQETSSINFSTRRTIFFFCIWVLDLSLYNWTKISFQFKHSWRQLFSL